MPKLERVDNPTEADFPLIDRCVECGNVCEWQPRYEIACRPPEHFAELSAPRPFSYVPDARVVKICAECVPEYNEELKRMIRQYYPVYALKQGI